MKSLPANDPLNYHNQAQVHPDSCPHGNWYWLPWHRVYILYFEQACRRILDDARFTIPYWDWAHDNSIPAAFWDRSSPLYSSKRAAGPTDEFSITSSEYNQILSTNTLVDIYSSSPPTADLRQSGGTAFYEQIHNRLHNFVGSDFKTFSSSSDPLFWAHHANIDRIWTSWERLHPGIYPTETDWSDFIFEGFYDPYLQRQVSEPLTKNGRDQNILIAYEQYDRPTLVNDRRIAGRLLRFDPEGLRQARVFRSDVDIAATVKLGSVVKATLRLDGDLGRIVDQAARNGSPLELYLIAEGVEFEDASLMGVRVLMNAPNPEQNSDANQASYVGTISSFDDPKHDAHRVESRGRFIMDNSSVGKTGSGGNLCPGPFRFCFRRCTTTFRRS
jgi:hypothetical protein